MNDQDALPVVADREFERRYVDLELLGTRQVSCSFKATDTEAGRAVFLKALNPAVVDDATAVRIFLHEPTVLRAIVRQAPQVPALRVLDLGRWNGRPFFTLPLLAGWSLDRVVKTKACFHPLSAVRIIEGCLRVLEPLHGAGFAHGDVSPDNIFIETDAPLSADGTLPGGAAVRLLDFNSVRELDRSDPELPIFYKPGYASPELYRAGQATVQSDLYALGMVFYQLLAGNVPYRLADWSDAGRVTLHLHVPPLPAILEVPRLVEALVRQLLSTAPSERPGSASHCLRLIAELSDVHDWFSRTGPPEAAKLGPGFTPVRVGTRRRSDAGHTGVGSSEQRVRDPTRIPLTPFSADSVRPSPPVEGPDRGADDRLTPTVRPADLLRMAERGPDARVNASSDEQPLVPPNFSGEPREWTGAGAPGRAETADDADTDVPHQRPAAHHVPVPRDGRQADRVDFSVFAPPLISPGRSFVLEVWAYLRTQRDEMLARASLAERVERGTRGPVAVTRETELTLVLRLDGFVVPENQDTIVWQGEATNVPFVVEAPPQLARGSYPGQVSIMHCGMLLSRLVFDLVVGAPAGAVGVRQERVSSAFASYAREDQAEVFRRVQGIQAAGVTVFVDVLSLRAGQDWELRIVDSIRQSDVFYLFWSVHASQSQWVAKEWRLALEERGIDYIHPIPLADPSEAPPPQELASRHFNDLVLACLKSQAVGLPRRPA